MCNKQKKLVGFGRLPVPTVASNRALQPIIKRNKQTIKEIVNNSLCWYAYMYHVSIYA